MDTHSRCGTREGEYALTNEAFCGVLAHVSIDAKDAPDFLEAVVPFVNEKVWGTLSCSLILHSESEKRYPEAVDQAIAGLKYGGIGINVWPVSFTDWSQPPGCPPKPYPRQYRLWHRRGSQQLPLRPPRKVGSSGTVYYSTNATLVP